MNKTKLKKKEITELMEGLGFHYIPSKNRWKMKKVNIMTITDFDLETQNDSNHLMEFLEGEFEEQLDTLKQFERKQKMIRIFFQ